MSPRGFKFSLLLGPDVVELLLFLLLMVLVMLLSALLFFRDKSCFNVSFNCAGLDIPSCGQMHCKFFDWQKLQIGFVSSHFLCLLLQVKQPVLTLLFSGGVVFFCFFADLIDLRLLTFAPVADDAADVSWVVLEFWEVTECWSDFSESELDCCAAYMFLLSLVEVLSLQCWCASVFGFWIEDSMIWQERTRELDVYWDPCVAIIIYIYIFVYIYVCVWHYVCLKLDESESSEYTE